MISTPDFYSISQDTQIDSSFIQSSSVTHRDPVRCSLLHEHGNLGNYMNVLSITSSSSTGCSTDPAQTTNHTQLLLSLIPFTLMLFCFYAFWDDICCFREYPSRATLHLSALSPDKLIDSFLAGAQCLLPILEMWTLTPCPRCFWPPLNYFYPLL